MQKIMYENIDAVLQRGELISGIKGLPEYVLCSWILGNDAIREELISCIDLPYEC